jgi:hypothetical protein
VYIPIEGQSTHRDRFAQSRRGLALGTVEGSTTPMSSSDASSDPASAIAALRV